MKCYIVIPFHVSFLLLSLLVHITLDWNFGAITDALFHCADFLTVSCICSFTAWRFLLCSHWQCKSAAIAWSLMAFVWTSCQIPVWCDCFTKSSQKFPISLICLELDSGIYYYTEYTWLTPTLAWEQDTCVDHGLALAKWQDHCHAQIGSDTTRQVHVEAPMEEVCQQLMAFFCIRHKVLLLFDVSTYEAMAASVCDGVPCKSFEVLTEHLQRFNVMNLERSAFWCCHFAGDQDRICARSWADEANSTRITNFQSFKLKFLSLSWKRTLN